ncbi:unnamed protein product [Bursaphelenchus okinawaensis]|uniref:PHD-type domain-containing protein n=1 Tax=Bursaphelenchus okinawaensis TaxID=465554 RepID=A0A811K940_9BILA|nr:unnamed protein product [Bursaphelenchus okinawaensis]CAG9097154.1 unnamed protein product [Bursaphelenchus okinawaensis]
MPIKAQRLLEERHTSNLMVHNEDMTELNLDISLAKESNMGSPAMFSPASSTGHMSFDCPIPKRSGRSKHFNSMESEEDDEVFTKSTIENEKRRIRKYIINNFYFHLHKTKRQLNVEDDEEERFLKYAGISRNGGEYSENLKDEIPEIKEEEPEGFINKPKPFIAVDISCYAQKQADEFRKKLLEESELRKIYEPLEYPDVPAVSKEEAELKLLATMLIQVKKEQDEEDLVAPSCSTSSESTEQTPETSTEAWSRGEDLEYKNLERRLFVLNGMGRQVAAKYRRMFRAEVDCSSTDAMLTQRRRLRQRHEADQQKIEELNRKKYKLKKAPITACSAKRGRPGKKTSNHELSTPTTTTTPVPTTPHNYKRPTLTYQTPVSKPTRISKSASTNHSPVPSMAKLLEATKPSSAFLREAPGAEFMMRPAIILGQNSKFSPDPVDVERIVRSIQNASSVVGNDNVQVSQERVKRKYTKRKHNDSKTESDATPVKVKVRGRRPTIDKEKQTKPRKDSLNSNLQVGRKPSKKQIAAEHQKRLEIDLGLVDERGDVSSSDGSFTLPAEIEEPCAFEECRIRDVLREAERNAIEWVQCDFCDKWFHCICALQSNRPVGQREVFRCRHLGCPSALFNEEMV